MQQRRKGGTDTPPTGSPNISSKGKFAPPPEVYSGSIYNARNAPNNSNDAGMDIPHGFSDVVPDSSKKSSRSQQRTHPQLRKKRGRHDPDGSNSQAWNVGFGLLMAMVLMASYFLVSHHEQKQLKLLREEIVHDQVEPLSREWEEKYADLQEENEKLKTDALQYGTLQEENERLLEEKHQFSKLRMNLEGRMNDLTKYSKQLQKNIQQFSIRILLEKFGEGPHHVEINVAFDPAGQTDASLPLTGQIIIELAPIIEMPHTVYWFLEQVQAELYNGCSFHRNAPHLIQAGPTPNFLTPTTNTTRLSHRFEEAGLEHILFQEYSPNFPHVIYTLGMAGRPSGPDLYISKKDNSKLHGPGGQQNYEDPSEADPCFAKVISGTEIVDRMGASPVKEGGYKAMEHNVAITSMKILPKEDKKNSVNEQPGQLQEHRQEGGEIGKQSDPVIAEKIEVQLEGQEGEDAIRVDQFHRRIIPVET